jgi:hypothetical protein
MYKQPTSDEYDLALLEAKRDLAIKGTAPDDSEDDTAGKEFITKGDFFRDLKKVSRRIDGSKSFPEQSET